jgi:nitrogen regulatory protein PII
MKRIEATIRMEHIDEVIVALQQTGATGVTVMAAMGHGVHGGLSQQWRGRNLHATLLPKVTLWTVVPDEESAEVLETLIAAARTGTMGDGKVFVSEVCEAFRVRTGERGDSALLGATG